MENLAEKINTQLALESDHFFLKDESRKITFKEFKSLSNNISQKLKKINLTKDDLVLLDIKDPFYFAAYTFACLNLNLRPAFLNFYMKPEQIRNILEENTYALFISDQNHSEFKCLKVDSAEPLDLTTSSEPFKISPKSEMIFFTSGSIHSKACVLTLDNFFFSAAGSHENIPFHQKDRWGLTLPLFHVGGFSILIRSILSEGSIVVLNSERSLSDQVLEKNISHLSLVSTQFVRFLEQYKKMSSLKFILLGGSAIPQSAIEKGLELNLPIYKSYGMTEMASQICTTKELENIEEAPLSGRLLEYRELKIEEGKIFVKGPCLFKGYLKNNKILPATSDGWFETNDNGQFENDQIKVLGRSDRIFQSAGENISPEFIEAELLKVQGISKAYVHPEPDDTHGLRAVAYVETKLNPDAIYKKLEGKLSGFYRPKAIKPWDQSPKTSWKM